VAADWQRKLVDFTEYRLPDMDKNGVDMQVLSLTSPGIQVQADPDVAVADARMANDFLADVINQHPQRFAGLAAIPMLDPPKARRAKCPWVSLLRASHLCGFAATFVPAPSAADPRRHNISAIATRLV
jgi:predicted TIM-barrel fold metal-dependent hydrolase